ncbi:MAG: hypothetical protein AAGH99_01755 [Planctomycetota bacterium]
MSNYPPNTPGRSTANPRGLSGEAATALPTLALDAKDLATALRVSKGTVESLRNEGVLVAIPLRPRCIRYPVELNLRRLERYALGQPLDPHTEVSSSPA